MPKRITHIHRGDEPAALEARSSIMRSMSTIAAMEAITQGLDVVIYSVAGSHIIQETAELAERLGRTLNVSDDGTRVRIQNEQGQYGTLTLRTLDKSLQRNVGQPDNLAEINSKNPNIQLYDQLIEDEKQRASDVVHLHEPLFSGYLKRAGLENVLVHLHLSPDTYRLDNYTNIGEVYPEVRDGMVRPSQPVITPSKKLAQDCRERGMDVLNHVYHGVVPLLNDDSQTGNPANYLFSLGRITPEKGPHRAIEIARESGRSLVIAGGIKPADQEYFNEQVKPHITEPFAEGSFEATKELVASLHQKPLNDDGTSRIIYVGQVTDAQKALLFGNASAFLFPMVEPEAFGLVMTEALSCHTPVVGFAKSGSVHEVLDEGKTGFIVAGEERQAINGAIDVVKTRLSGINRATIGKEFEEKWSAAMEAAELSKVYGAFAMLKHIRSANDFVDLFPDKAGRIGFAATCLPEGLNKRDHPIGLLNPNNFRGRLLQSSER